MKIIEIQSTFPDLESATNTIKYLISKKQNACANILPTQSLYTWEGKLNQESESLVLMKTSVEMKVVAIKEIKKIHPYQVPAIISWETECNDEYGRWVMESTSQFI